MSVVYRTICQQTVKQNNWILETTRLSINRGNSEFRQDPFFMMALHGNSHVMRPLEERHVAVQIDLMVWSSKMDLLALSYANGEVVLHRLNWLKVWVMAAPAEGVVAKGLAWRPDGKVIAIGYSNRELWLVDVELKDILSKTTMAGDITCVVWSEQICGGDEFQSPTLHHKPHKLYLPLLPSLTRGVSEKLVNDAKRVEDQNDLNFLYVGLSNGKLVMSIFGLFPRATIDVKTLLNLDECVILNAGPSRNQDVLLVTVLSGSSVWVATLDTSLLFSQSNGLMTLANKYGQITSCLDYMDLTLQSIIEGWENIMMEMETKLRTYADKVPKGRVSCDFLELLMFGTATLQMYEFLIDDLKEKGLKKLNNSIEISYSNIQGLVLRHLQAMGQNLSFHLNELCGLSRCPSFNQVLGLQEQSAMAAFSATGSFMIKATEVQQVIDESLKKYKAFFRWLFAAMLRLTEERASVEQSSMSREDLQHIVDFLCELERDDGFNIEQLGQYLVDAPLVTPAPSSEPWDSFLNKFPNFAALPHLVKHNKNFTLVQEARHLREAVTAVFEATESVIESNFLVKMSKSIEFSEGIDITNMPKVTHSYNPEQKKFMLAILDPLNSKGYHFLDVWTTGEAPSYTFIESNNPIVDLQFYLPQVLSLLMDMSPEQVTGFAQMSFPLVGEPCSMRLIQGIVAKQFAVCGIRKVAVVLSESRRKVKLFEMDVEEEDEDEGMDTTNSSARDTDLDLSLRL